MQLRQLGNSDLHITPIVFGAWAIGGWMWGGTDESDALAAIHASLDNGVNTIDTAAIYGMGASEELVGKAIKGKRDKVIIATKCGMRWDSEEGTDPWPQTDNSGRPVIIRKNSKPDSIVYECEQSLQRLGVDTIDLYQIHWPDTSTPVEDSMAAMLKLKEQGKIRAIGVSNYDKSWLAAAAKVAPIASNQPPYSLIQRKIETDLVPFARQNNIALIVYSPLERGLLAGAVPPDRQFSDRRSPRHPQILLRRKPPAHHVRPPADQANRRPPQRQLRPTCHQLDSQSARHHRRPRRRPQCRSSRPQRPRPHLHPHPRRTDPNPRRLHPHRPTPRQITLVSHHRQRPPPSHYDPNRESKTSQHHHTPCTPSSPSSASCFSSSA